MVAELESRSNPRVVVAEALSARGANVVLEWVCYGQEAQPFRTCLGASYVETVCQQEEEVARNPSGSPRAKAALVTAPLFLT